MEMLMNVKNYLAFVCLFAVLAARATTLTYTGANAGDWDTPSNWDGGAVPTIDDDVVINAKWVKAAGSVSANSITITGTASTLNAGLVIGGTTATEAGIIAQTPIDATSTAPIALNVAGNLALDKAGLSLGGRDAAGHVSALIGGDFVVTNGAIAAFYAGVVLGISYTDVAGMSAALYAGADIVTVGGEMRIGAGSTVHPENNKVSGTPIIFKPTDFTLEAGGVLSATGRGFGWFPIVDAESLPDGAHRDRENTLCGTYCPGSGFGYIVGGGYGGDGRSAQTSNDKNGNSVNCGKAYGFDFAPLLPGAVKGGYKNDDITTSRSGGTVCVFATGRATISGKVESKCKNANNYGSGSGGGIWVCAASLGVEPSASFDTEGGVTSYTSQGSGGRIALGVGLSALEIETMAGGTLPANLSSFDLYGVDFNVFGGGYATGRAGSGTAKIVYSTADAIALQVTTSGGEEFGSPTPGYGLNLMSKAAVPQSFALPPVIADAWRGFRRYAQDGYAVTTTAGAAVADISAAGEPLVLTWNWSTVEDLVRIRPVGGGTITVNGTDYATSADIWVASGAPLSVSEPDGTGAFEAWYGDFDGGKSTAAALSLTATPGMTIYGVFSDATGTAKSYIGANDGFWDVDANWSPAGVPSPLDDVTISSKQVKSYGVTVAKSLALSAGKLAVGGASAATTTAQTAPTDFLFTGSGLCIAGNLSATGASAISVGAGRQTVPLLCATVGGNLSLAGTSTLTVYAPEYDGELDDGGKIPIVNLYFSAFPFTVGGDMVLDGSAVVYPDSDIVSGNPVRFDVAGDVTVGASASFNATTRGWGWTRYTDGVGDPRATKKDAEGSKYYYTLSTGFGYSYTRGGVYGADGLGPQSGYPRLAYGFAYAPYLNGGPDGCYSPCRGGGTVWVKAGGTFTLNGKIYAKGGSGSGTSSKSAGGGVWICGSDFAAGENGAINANGADGGNADYAPGTGGRVSIALGVADADLDALARGETPSGLSYSGTITLVTATVTGGFRNNNGDITYNPDGTLTTVMGALNAYPLTVSSSPVAVTAEGLDYSAVNVTVGVPYAVTAPAYAFDPAYSNTVRYACAGWVVSNATAEVASGAGTTASFTPETGPFFLTWLWSGRETAAEAVANDSTLGAVAANGGAAGATAAAWVAESGTAAVTATPASGAEFLYWVGEVPYGKARDNPLSFATQEPRNVMAVFRVAEAPTTRTWKLNGGRQGGDWLIPTNWIPENIPGLNDDVVIVRADGDTNAMWACYVSTTNYVEVKSLSISGGAFLRMAALARGSYEHRRDLIFEEYYNWEIPGSRIEEAALVVSGDVIVTNTAAIRIGGRKQAFSTTVSIGGALTMADGAMMVFGRAIDSVAGFDFTNGTSRVTVPGMFSLRGDSVFYPCCEQYTGGGVVFRVGNVEIGEGAAIDASARGWCRDTDRSPISTAPGLGYAHTIGGGYGGYGGNHTETYGLIYGNEYAPILPGSSGGSYGYVQPAGGLIRIHAHKATIAGTLNADGGRYSSGGGIWLTTAKGLEIASTALFTARGGFGHDDNNPANRGAAGGGGRIALWSGISDAQIDELARTGTLSAWSASKFASADISAAFLAAYPSSVAVGPKVTDDPAYTDGDGTFRYLANPPPGFMIYVR